VADADGRTSEAACVSRDDTDVMFLRTNDDVATFGPLWERLERLVGTRGRKFFGAVFVDANEYWVCVQTREGDDASALGLESGTLPGGWHRGLGSAESRPRCTCESVRPLKRC
jgi:hypothetical protein